MLPGRAMLLCSNKLEQMEQRIRSLEDQFKQQDIRNIARAHGQAPSIRSSPANAKQPRFAKTNAVGLVGQESLAFDPSVRGSKALKRQTIAEFVAQKPAGMVVQAI